MGDRISIQIFPNGKKGTKASISEGKTVYLRGIQYQNNLKPNHQRVIVPTNQRINLQKSAPEKKTDGGVVFDPLRRRPAKGMNPKGEHTTQ